MADFVKRTDLEFVAQLNNFKSKLGNYQAVLGLTNAQIDAAEDDADFMAFAVLGSITANTYKEGWSSLKQNVRGGDGTTPIGAFPAAVNIATPPTSVAPGVEQRFRAIVAQIKTNPAYTKAMGEDLQIIAAVSTSTLEQPELSVKVDGGNAIITFKKGKSNGVKIYGKRGTETAFSFLAIDTRSPYVDNRPNETPGSPETRQYYAYFIINDEQVGGQSDVISINM